MGLVYAEIKLIRSDDLALWKAGYPEERQISRVGQAQDVSDTGLNRLIAVACAGDVGHVLCPTYNRTSA